jgi:hypothetical protein
LRFRRYGNERSRARWEDFIGINVTKADTNVMVFSDVGCFDGTYLCSEQSELREAVDINSLGYSVASQRDAGETVWLYAVSFVGTVTGLYRVDLKHGMVLNDLRTRQIVGGISSPSHFTVQVRKRPLRTGAELTVPCSWARVGTTER